MIEYVNQKKMKKLLIFIGLMVAGILIFSIWWSNGQKPVDPNDNTKKIFVIQRGQGIREIANKLNKEGLVKDPVVFFLTVKKMNKDRDIQAGDYRLSPSMDLNTMISTLLHGTIDIWVTFPEGLRGEEIAEILENNFNTYNNSWKEKLLLNNGYLFPDTYLFPKEADIDLIITKMTDAFNEKMEEIGLDKDLYKQKQVVIIASIIERETKTDNEKPIVSGILHNRLSSQIPLQVDATVQYAKGYSNNKWWPTISVNDYKEVNSPYNTYLFTGLPPAPIANPGFESIKAALNPQATNYYYYLHDSKGVIHYAQTVYEHNENIRKYLR